MWREGDNYGDVLKLPRAGVMKRDQRILDKMRDFLLGKERVDTVLFTYFRGRVGRRAE
jgi:hypothetical protein